MSEKLLFGCLSAAILALGGCASLRSDAMECPDRVEVDGFYRSGYSPCAHRYAKPSNGRYYHGYYVGGGAPVRCGSDIRCCDEGTYGWDYALPWQRVNLRWWHGRFRQGGQGQYETDKHNIGFDDLVDP